MKCFIKNLLNNNSLNSDSSDVCVPLPPIVGSLIGSVAFVVLMTVASHLIR